MMTIRISSIDPEATAAAQAALAAELAATSKGVAALRPGDAGHPDTPRLLAKEAIIAKALALADEAALAAAAESAWS